MKKEKEIMFLLNFESFEKVFSFAGAHCFHSLRCRDSDK